MLKGIRNSAIATGLIVTLMVVTNPTEDAYAKYIVWKFQNTTCSQQQLAACHTIKTLPRSISKPMLKGYIYRQNFIFFSFYETNFFDLKSRNIGIYGYFF
ncbi:DUF4359 domain-containing protein [Scytonema sp. NUACC26]|uniref:DUF4359 domain-containing protein n=1 Tax=Scytonema sp. NUACC26 TaxID=3140176 RepID=UPI0034DC68B9